MRYYERVKTDILFSILMTLVAKKAVSRASLAERYEVSERTVSRYISFLADMGVPIESISGQNGCIRLRSEYALDRTYFTEGECEQIKRALTAYDSDSKLNAKIIDKLQAVKTATPDTCELNTDTLYIDCGSACAKTLSRTIKQFQRAIDQHRRVDITYTDYNRYVTSRTVEPQTLVFKDGWYVFAFCRKRNDFRLFKLTRINALRVTSENFVPLRTPVALNIERAFCDSSYVNLRIAFFQTLHAEIADWLGLDSIIDTGAEYIAEAVVPSNNRLVARLLSFGSSVRVISPAHVAEEVRTEAARLLQKYED